MTSVFDTSRHMKCRFDKESLGNTHQRGFLLWSLMLIAIKDTSSVMRRRMAVSLSS